MHTGQQHWVCVGSIGCEDGTVNLYDSLYHNIIYSEVEDQVINLVGQENWKTGIQVGPVQQQKNGSDCGVFAAAFATCLAHGTLPQTVQFDVCKMRSHLYHSLKNGQLQMFPTGNMTKVIILLFRMNAIKSGYAQDVYFREDSAVTDFVARLP